MISTSRKINAILLNIKIKSTKIGEHVWIYTGNKLAKFYRTILSLSDDIAKKRKKVFWGYFLTHTVHIISYDITTFAMAPINQSSSAPHTTNTIIA